LRRFSYKLVDHEKSNNNTKYIDARDKVHNKLKRYVSEELPSSHLNLDYIAAEAIRRLTAHSTMGDMRSTSRVNIIQNKYFLNDDYEDPGFHLN
jgi:hypothetical protein